MIKKILFVSLIVTFFASCKEEDSKPYQCDTTVIEMTSNSHAKEILLSKFDSIAGDYVGKEVTVSGIVDHVCKHGGKKILLVDGDNSIHVFNDERYDEALSGSKVSVIGVVEEEKVDSTSLVELLKHEEGSHGDKDNEEDVKRIERVKEYIKMMQDSLKKVGVDHFSNYSLKYVSHTEVKDEETKEEK